MVKLLAKNLRYTWCKGCGYCVDACPKNALSIGSELNKQGYAYIVFDETKCVTCGACRTVCPDSVFVFTEEEGGE